MENNSNEIIKEKCPYNRPLLQKVFKLTLMVLGAVGLYFLNIWVAVVYLIYYCVWSFFLMPVKHCQYCYYKVKEIKADNEKGNPIKTLLSKEKWVESYLKKHVACGKKWGFNLFLLWLLPIVLIIISLFLSFSIVALLCLIGFITVLGLMLAHMKYKVCPTCAIVDECHAAF